MAYGDGGMMVMFRIISRHSWNVLQGWHKACPGSTVEHLMYGLYVLIIPAGRMNRGAAYNTFGTSPLPGGVPYPIGPVESTEKEW